MIMAKETILKDLETGTELYPHTVSYTHLNRDFPLDCETLDMLQSSVTVSYTHLETREAKRGAA